MNFAVGPGVDVAQLAAAEAELRAENDKAKDPVAFPAIKPQPKRRRQAQKEPDDQAAPKVVATAGDQPVEPAES
jgi:hypothetical protein